MCWQTHHSTFSHLIFQARDYRHKRYAVIRTLNGACGALLMHQPTIAELHHNIAAYAILRSVIDTFRFLIYCKPA